MSGPQVEYFPEVHWELEDALEWYLERSSRAGEAFLREVDRAVALIAATPKVWAPFEAGTRRYVLQRFPYDIIYRETEAGIQIVAVAHQKRQPKYWYGRLGR